MSVKGTEALRHAGPNVKSESPVDSLRALLMNVIDYAGLFPPAKLDMETTVRNYAKYLQSDESWMLGRLIVPAARLGEIEQVAGEYLARVNGEDDAWQVSALTSPAHEFEKLQSDLSAIASFNAKHEGRAIIDVIEIKAEKTADIDRALDEIPEAIFPYVELPIDNDPRGLIATLVDADAGAKVRTGGISADAYPSPENLARFIAACAAADVPFKATAGLHHPLRHHSDAVKAREFGFLNVFMAGCMAYRLHAQPKVIQQILEDESIDSFDFSDATASWRDLRLTVDEIEEAHQEFAVAFGSCSFEEPIADLGTLNLM